MDKLTKQYLRDKHKSLNSALLDTRNKNLSQLSDMVNDKNAEIRNLERKLRWITFGFFSLFALTVLAGVVISFLLAFSKVVETTSITATGFASEIAIYYALTKDIQIRLNNLIFQRDKVENELIISSKEISKILIDEQRAITEVLTKDKEILVHREEKDDEEEEK